MFIAILLIGGVGMFFGFLKLSKIKVDYLKEKSKRRSSFEEAEELAIPDTPLV